MISYAQAREDVLLDRALRHVHHSKGFYIDVGAFDPDHDSVTRHFYDHGWRGINIEPSERSFRSFPERRPRDINVQAAVSDKSGVVTFHEVENGQLSTLEARVAEQHTLQGCGSRSYDVPAMTITEICDRYVEGNIHFLKIDVEGHEAAAIRGMDFNRYRPWILVIEATEPNRLDKPTHHEWEHLIFDAGYRFGLSDLPNRYYVAREHPSLMQHFVNPVDDYVYSWVLRERDEARALAKGGVS